VLHEPESIFVPRLVEFNQLIQAQSGGGRLGRPRWASGFHIIEVDLEFLQRQLVRLGPELFLGSEVFFFKIHFVLDTAAHSRSNRRVKAR
jgi:hypothetical protein